MLYDYINPSNFNQLYKNKLTCFFFYILILKLRHIVILVCEYMIKVYTTNNKNIQYSQQADTKILYSTHDRRNIMLSIYCRIYAQCINSLSNKTIPVTAAIYIQFKIAFFYRRKIIYLKKKI